MKRKRFRETRTWKRLREAMERLTWAKLGGKIRGNRRGMPSQSKEGLTGTYQMWLHHDLRAGYSGFYDALSLSRDIARNTHLKKRLYALFKETEEARKKFGSFTDLIIQREERVLKDHVGFKRKYSAMMNLVEGLRKKLSRIRESDLSQENRELIEALEGANSSMLYSERLLRDYQARELSAKPRLERIETGRFVEDIARTEINSLLVGKRIPVSVNIDANLIITMNRLEFERCIRNVVGNSAEHNPGHRLEIKGYLSKENPNLAYLEFLSRDGKPLPERIVKTPSDMFSSTGKVGKGFGTTITFHLLRRHGHFLKAENTPDGPKFVMEFRI